MLLLHQLLQLISVLWLIKALACLKNDNSVIIYFTFMWFQTCPSVFLLLSTKEDILKDVGNQTVDGKNLEQLTVAIDFHWKYGTELNSLCIHQGQKWTFPLRGNFPRWNWFPGPFFYIREGNFFYHQLNNCICVVFNVKHLDLNNYFNQSKYLKLLPIAIVCFKLYLNC